MRGKNDVKVTWVLSDMFQDIEGTFDMIVSNPPYIRTEVIKTLPKEVQNEPHIALDGGEDGLEFYKIFANEAHKYLKPEGTLLVEIGFDQATSVCKLLESRYKEIKIKKDLGKNDRIIIARR